MRISNLSILLVVFAALASGCAGKRNREPNTTYWNDARDCQAVCQKCQNNAAGQMVETNPINPAGTFDNNSRSQDSAVNLNCLGCNRKTDVLMDGKCIECLKQNIDQRALQNRGNSDGWSGDELGGRTDGLDATSQTGSPPTTRRKLSTPETGSESVEFQRQPHPDTFSSPLNFLTPSKEQADGNRDQSSPIPKIQSNDAKVGNAAPHEIADQELHAVQPLPVLSNEVVDQLPLKSRSEIAVDDAQSEPKNRLQATGEKNSQLIAKGVAMQAGKQESDASGTSSNSDPKSELFRLQDLFPNTVPNLTFFKKPDASESMKKATPKSGDDIDWGLPTIVQPNWNPSPGNRGANGNQDEAADGNDGDSPPPLNPPDSWQGNSSAANRQFSGRSEQEIIRDLRRSKLATSNGLDHTATISEQKPGLQAVLLTAKPVPQYHQLLQIEQERNQPATDPIRSVSQHKPIDSGPCKIPARSVSHRKEVLIDNDFDFRPIPELAQPGEFTLEPVDAEKFIEEIIQTFSFPAVPVPPASVPAATNERNGQWFSADSELLIGSGQRSSDRKENRVTDFSGSTEGSKAHFRFEQPSFQRERSQ